MLTRTIINLARIAVVITLVFVGCDVFALCSDARHPSVMDEFKSSRLVLVARVTASQDEPSPDDAEGIDKTIYHLDIKKVFKGVTNTELSITSENTSGRFPMDVGKSYLLFIKSYNSLNIVDPCGNSGPLADRAAEVAILKKTTLPLINH